MGWPEVPRDEFERQQFDRGVEARVRVLDANRGDNSRTYALLKIEYSDRDGERAAALLNTLVDVWIQDRIARLREPAQERSARAKDEADRAMQTWSAYAREKRELELTYGIRPDYGLEQQRQQYQERVKEAQQREEALAEKRRELRGIEVKVLRLQERLGTLVPRVAPQQEMLLSRATDYAAKHNHKALAQLINAAMYHRRAMLAFRPGTSQYRSAQRSYDMVTQQIGLLLPSVQVDSDGMVPNPDHEKVAAELREAELQRDQLQAEVAELERAKAASRAEFERLVEGFRFYEEKLQRLKEAARARDEAQQKLKAEEDYLARLTSDVPVTQVKQALVPATPTEPNIMLVGLLGCLLGLGAAIGLILVFDFLQGTFKTIDDVERGLAVPVLGGVSYLETDEERQRAVRGRRRASFAAAAALLLITTVVTIFYVDPTRLPPFVRDLLTILLGA